MNRDPDLWLWPDTISFDSGDQMCLIKGYEKFNDFTWPKNGFFHLHGMWHDYKKYRMPLDRDYYVLSWHGEYIDWQWLLSHQLTQPIYLLTDFGKYDQTNFPDNIQLIKWYHWHRVLDKMMSWYGSEFKKNIKYKASAFCNRVTQSKVWITTALLQTLNESDRLISLSDWVEPKNVHHWAPTGNKKLDDLTDYFQTHYLGKKIMIDDFLNERDNNQKFTADPRHPAYQNTALHFTNESFHYSLMTNETETTVFPGPNFSEKTLKCLLGETAFIPVGQFDVYGTLSNLGFDFNYGMDLSFDNDPGNLSRMASIVDLVYSLKDISAEDIYKTTLESTLHNHEHIVSKKFYKICEDINDQSLISLRSMF